MRFNYSTGQNPDGSRSLVVKGPVSRAWRGVRIVWGALFVVVAIILGCQCDWTSAGFALITVAIILPTLGRRKGRTAPR